MNSSSGGGRAFAVSKCSVVQKQEHTKYEENRSPTVLSGDIAVLFQLEEVFLWSLFTFSTLLFTFLLFLLPLVQHRCSLCSLLQLGHEVLYVIETVIEDPLREGEPVLLCCSDMNYSQRRLKRLKRWWGGVPLLSPLAGKRYQARRSLLQKRGEDSVHPFPFMALVFAAFRNSCPSLPLKPTPLTHTHKHTKQSLCS